MENLNGLFVQDEVESEGGSEGKHDDLLISKIGEIVDNVCVTSTSQLRGKIVCFVYLSGQQLKAQHEFFINGKDAAATRGSGDK